MGASATPAVGTYETLPQYDAADIPEDFKIGVTVDQSAPQIRALFTRKVYTMLFLQLLGTSIVAAGMTAAGTGPWLYSHMWAMWVPFVGSLGSLGFIYWKAHEHPLNVILLGVFTLFEAVSVGMLVSLVDQTAVLKAFMITSFVFAGLTLYTLQSEQNFESLGSWLYMGLLVVVGAGLVQLFMPSRLLELVYSVGGVAVFSGYIVFDTWMIQRRLSPDDWVLANVSLYLDVINLFISILRLLNSSSDD
ncbi:hypothetical protein MCUN1_003283 [Malassezia cuniculi]|uniref:Protein lifeguard 4 n=1 Tax=Malassezia cuniculi TaxID=948313 RepID=A0AAF0J847_9BASI|nr:hypothetical protein MCUN1_003283 [Malassezia cuniculi]